MNIFLRNLLYTILVLTLFIYRSNAQELHFYTLTEEQVFDKQPVLSIMQDNTGKIWFAGANDIYVYNSSHITALKDQDSSWNKVGYISKLAINAKNELFISSSNGLHLYDIDRQVINPEHLKEDLKKFTAADTYDIQSLDSKLFICTKTGLYFTNYTDIFYKSQPLVTNQKVFTITTIAPDNYIFATANAIEQLKIDSRTQKPKITRVLDLPSFIAKNDVITTLFHSDGTIYVGTRLHGILCYDMKKQQLLSYHEKNSNLLSNYIRKICKGLDGNVWIGTLKGLSIYQGSSTFQNHNHNSMAPNSLSQNSIYDIFIDKQQITWVGTYFGGMNVIYPHALHPKLYSTKENSPYRLNSDIIGSLTESTTGYWIGTEENGINYLDKKTQQIKSLPHYAQSNLIKDIQFRDNKLYIAQFSGGYSVVNLAKNIIRHHSLNRDTLDSRNNVFSIYADSNHTIYLGTNAGLYITNDVQSPPTLIHSIPQNTINRIKEDNYGNIYVQQSGSLFVKHKRTNQFMQLEALNSLLVTDFYVENDQLWLTVADQVYRLTDHRQLEKIVQWKGNPLGTIALTNNKLWVTSKQGLVYYDVKNAYTNILTKEDGLPSNNLVNAKIYVDKTKNILLATQNGLVAFPTEDIAFNTQAPQIYLSSFKINDRTITPDRLEADDDSHNIVVNLNHNETFLSIDFFSSNLIKPTKNRYRYMLKGIDKDWKEISSSSIQYTNLPIGAYTLTVYASNNDLVWSEKPLVISLIVHPPFYLTWWAYILYAILIFTITHFVIKFIVEREVLINSEKEHEKKIKFFTQISHEIRTPLTLITAPLDEIINETADQSATQHKVIRIKKNANKLLSVINELLDFKKLDDKKQQLRLQKTDLNTYLEDAFYLLSDFAQTKNLNYYIRKMDKTGLFWLDTQQFDKVMFNLLSNAIKYTPAGRTVYLELTKTTQGAEIRIVDNGIGISEANQFKIFEEYYREKSTEDVIGTGIGLALTKAIVEQHEGSISCNTLNENSIQWTVFQIELTQQVSRGNDDMSLYANTDTESIPDERDITALSSPVIISGDRKEILLIVEDNKELLEVITSIFHETYEVLTAQDGQEGFDKAKRYLPDLIISDMMMPKMNGLELCDDLKKNTLTSHIPFILLTAVNDETIHTETLKHGANIYITKPFDRSRLYLSVRNLLAIGQKRRKDFRISTAIDNEIDQKFISDLDQLIDDHLMDDNFDVNFISRSMGMSAPVLYRKLKAITDLSLNNYVKSYRLNKAKELLPSRKNISEVAYAVGFSDRKYFSREFKKLFGINPSEYLDRADRG